MQRPIRDDPHRGAFQTPSCEFEDVDVPPTLWVQRPIIMEKVIDLLRLLSIVKIVWPIRIIRVSPRISCVLTWI